MPIETTFALMMLAGLVGHMAGLYRAKRYMRQEAERVATKLTAAQEDAET